MLEVLHSGQGNLDFYIDIGSKAEGNKPEVETMKTINVYQCELDREIPLEYVGQVKYSGESFGVDSLTDGEVYDVVRDETGMIKIVDDSEEDYIYDLVNPKPLNGSSPGGKFRIIDDPNKELGKYILQ